MPLEDLTGPDKFIDALNNAWPLGSDSKNDGDDHIRGVKNVLVNQFPNTSAAIPFNDAEWSNLGEWALEDPSDYPQRGAEDIQGPWNFESVISTDAGLQLQDGALISKLVLTQTPGPPTGNSNGTITFVYTTGS